MKKGYFVLRAACAGFLAVCALGSSALAQSGGRAIFEEQLRVDLDRQMPRAREMGFDAGAWFTFAVFRYDDAAAGKIRNLQQYELRAWGSMDLGGSHRAYIRALFGWDDWHHNDNPLGRGDEDTQEIERAWYELNLDRMFANQTGQQPLWRFRTKVGRQFAEIGSALTLSMPLDMVQITAGYDDFDVRLLLAMTIRNSRNIDNSAPVHDHQERCFYGVELTYDGFSRHRPFVYFLLNDDNTDEDPADPLQNYEYDSTYVGLGSKGTLLLPDLRYVFEIVGQWGRTYSDGATADRDYIEAMALDFQLEHLFRTKMKPKVSFEYLFGSGDPDRRLSATSTIGGNEAGTTDRAFNAFGFRDLGISFSPKPANLHSFVLGGSFFPLEDIELFRKMEVGTKLFFYAKNFKHGPLSDTTATRSNHWVGWEWDAYCNWRLTSDITWTIRYGAFQPGDAFQSQQTRHFLYTAATISF